MTYKRRANRLGYTLQRNSYSGMWHAELLTTLRVDYWRGQRFSTPQKALASIS